jgi:hypothetical protein
MATLNLEPYASFVRDFAAFSGCRDFVETGTHLGVTALWASSVFTRVFTAEINPDYQKLARERCAGRGNIEFLLGSSDRVLQVVVKKLNGPAVFWLDAHTGGGNYASFDHCPLLAELQVVAARRNPDDLILIDDARAFVAPPPPPFDHKVWPPIHAVLDAADPRRERHSVVIGDMIICAPPRFRDRVLAFCTEVRPTI